MINCVKKINVLKILVTCLGAFNKEEDLKGALSDIQILFSIFRWHFYSTVHQDNLVHQQLYILVLDLDAVY